MNILYINHYAGSIYHGMEYRPYYLAREWVRLGHSVTIIASDLSHLRHTNAQIPAGSNYLHETIDGINYIWCRTVPYGENGLKRVINIFSFLWRVNKLKNYLIKTLKPNLVIASSTYPFDTKVAAKIAKAAGAKFVYEVHDLWPLTPMEVGGMSKWHPFIMAMQRAEDFGYRRADKVVSLLPKAAEYMHEHGMDYSKFIYIPNGVVVDDWVNSQEVISKTISAKFDELKAGRKFIIGYAGGMGESNALKFLLDAAKLILDKPIAIVLVGDGACRPELQQRLIDENIPNVHFMGSIGKLQIPDFLTRCDALYIGWNNLPIYRFGISPNKLFDYMLAQKPIIHSVSAGNDLVFEANCGISVPAENVQAIVDAFVDISQMSDENLIALGNNGQKYVLHKHDYKVIAQQFLAAI